MSGEETVWTLQEPRRRISDPVHGDWFVAIEENDWRYLHRDGIVRVGTFHQGEYLGWFPSREAAEAAIALYRKRLAERTQAKRPTTVAIDVCERLMDRTPDGDPKYHAQVQGEPGCWACGTTIDDAIGNLVRCHAERFGVEIVVLEGQVAR